MPSTIPAVSFSQADETEMIGLIQERRYLWDAKDARYHRRDLKDKAYEDVVSVLGPGFTGAAVKARFSNLRSQFQREIRKLKGSNKSGASLDDLYVPSWGHYVDLLFLQSACPQHESQSNMVPPNDSRSSQVGADNSPWGHLEGSDPVDPSSFDLEDELSSCSQAPSPGNAPSSCHRGSSDGASTSGAGSSSGRPSVPAKRKQPDDCAAEKRLLLESGTQALSKAVEATKQKDECDDFGVMMANALRHVPQGPHRQMAGLLAHEAVVKYSMNINTRPEIIQVAPDE
ncbi:uncharacterized protein ISCGN_006154 [Ixodes scapularis]